jgi:hypothetical protein
MAIRIFAFACSFCLFISLSLIAVAQEPPSVLTCKSNGKASRDYGFKEKQWTGHKGHLIESSKPFQIFNQSSETSGRQYELRDKVFLKLNTPHPVVRSITRFQDGTENTAEFVSKVVSRTSDAVYLLWTNDFNNKMWLAGVDLRHRKAIVTQVFFGVTSVGGELETLDCH